MASATVWRKRIAAWRASGLTATEYAQARSLSAQQIWNWSWRLRKDEAARAARRAVNSTKPPATKCVRLARVIRVAAAPPAAPAQQAGLVVELRGVRIAVPTGFDRATFSAVLDAVERRPDVGRV